MGGIRRHHAHDLGTAPDNPVKSDGSTGGAAVNIRGMLRRKFGPHVFTGPITTSIHSFISSFLFKRWPWRPSSEATAAGIGGRAGLAAADLADAPGRPLPAGISRGPGQGRDFIALCTTPELAAEVTLQPIRRYGFDAAILFSDILMLPWALGQGLEYREGEGPVLPPLRDEAGVRGAAIRSASQRRSRRSWRRCAGFVRAGRRRLHRLRADRLCRRAVHGRLLHGRRRRLAGFRRDADHGLSPSRRCSSG